MQNDLNEFLRKKSVGDFNYFFRILFIKKYLIDDVINWVIEVVFCVCMYLYLYRKGMYIVFE